MNNLPLILFNAGKKTKIQQDKGISKSKKNNIPYKSLEQ